LQSALQRPQFATSVSVLTQRPLQSVVPVGQKQAPSTHDWPVAQARPQPPQFFVSESTFTQVPLQASWSGEQIGKKQLFWQLA
jgi:hypothetical protein